MTKKRSISNTKFCNYTITGRHVGHGHNISFPCCAANHFANFAKTSNYGWVNMVTSSSKRKQSVWLLICHFGSFRNSDLLLLVKKIWQPWLCLVVFVLPKSNIKRASERIQKSFWWRMFKRFHL